MHLQQFRATVRKLDVQCPLHHSVFITNLQHTDMQVEIGYNMTSLQEVAQFILENNASISKWPNPPKNAFELMRQMKDHVYRDVSKNVKTLEREKAEGVSLQDEWVNMTGTGGYTILYSLEDQKDDYVYMSVDFLVDPAVSKESTFVTESLDFDEDTV